MKIRKLGDELLREDGQTKRQTCRS